LQRRGVPADYSVAWVERAFSTGVRGRPSPLLRHSQTDRTDGRVTSNPQRARRSR
jgi:hypothetical protein